MLLFIMNLLYFIKRRRLNHLLIVAGMQSGYQNQGGNYSQYPDQFNQQYPPGSSYPPNRPIYPPYGPDTDRSAASHSSSLPLTSICFHQAYFLLVKDMITILYCMYHIVIIIFSMPIGLAYYI